MPVVGESDPLLRPLSSLGEDLKNLVNPTRTFTYILFVTVIIGGLQLAWCTELANGSPFLQSLGMSKALMSLVWIAGPLSGTIGQPIVGVFSDETRLKSGRRGPFIVGGGIATIISLLMLSWSKSIMGLFYPSLSEVHLKEKTIPFAVAWVYILDFSIAAIQAGARALIVDNVPTHQQQVANAWAARMTGIGNIIGYALGTLNLPKLAPFLGNTQFRALCTIASISLVVTVVPALWYVRERDPNTDPSVGHNDDTRTVHKLTQVWKDTIRAIRNLSPQSRLICNTQFFAWIGYFPLLFYVTTYVGAMYREDFFAHRPIDAPPLTEGEWDELWEESTRRGTAALVVYAITSLVASFLLPYIAESSYQGKSYASMGQGLERLLMKLRIPGLTVKRVWTLSHVVFFLTMMSTYWIRNAAAATVFVGVWGIVWAVALWAPFTLISEEISRIRVKKGKAIVTNDNNHRRYMSYEHEAGIVLGVFNVYISAPQVISSLISSLIFRLFSARPEIEAFGWVFRFGGLGAIIATYLSMFLKSPDQLEKEDEQANT